MTTLGDTPLLLQKHSPDNSIAHSWLDRDCFGLPHFQVKELMSASKLLVISRLCAKYVYNYTSISQTHKPSMIIN